jgi:hypothetical protein
LKHLVILQNLVDVFWTCDEHVPSTPKVDLDCAILGEWLLEVFVPKVLLVDVFEQWNECIIEWNGRNVFRKVRWWKNPACDDSVPKVREERKNCDDTVKMQHLGRKSRWKHLQTLEK